MLGFGKGKMELALSTASPQFGSILAGTATLQLKGPENARGFAVELIAERTVTETHYHNGKQDNVNRTETLYRTAQQLAGEGQYTAQPYQYSFQLKVPAEGEAPWAKGGFWNRLASGKVKWYVIAKLDIPGGFDVSKKIEIKVVG